jgi:hypothetical protein
MPLPNDEKLLALANDLLQQFDRIWGLNPGFRPAHAKGTMLTGVFTPADDAKSLSRAPHFIRENTPVSVRFSNSTGIPVIPDNNPNADPRGLAIRFHLADRVHTDIVSHSTDGFSHPHRRRIPGISARRRVHCTGRPASHAHRGVLSQPSRRIGLCADSQARSFQLRARDVLRSHRNALDQS